MNLIDAINEAGLYGLDLQCEIPVDTLIQFDTSATPIKKRLIVPAEACEAWCITGPKEKGNTNVMENIVWTAYPGSITCSLQQFDWWDGTDSQKMLDRLSKYPIAVKGIA